MAYAESARKLAEILNKKKAYKAFVKEFNRIGHEYFNSHKSGYAGAPSENEDQQPIQVLTKEEFAKEVLEYGRNEDEPIFENEAAFDDAFRHAVIIDTRALPKIVALPVDSFRNESGDYIFTWAQVDAFAKAHPDGRYVIVHGDVLGPQFFLPIPTPLNLFDQAILKEMGFNARTRKQRKQYKQRKTRKQRN
jgi:hypothetical protein